MHLVHVLHRYPPALGGAEKYAAELTAYHTARGDAVTVWTSTAHDLEAMRYAGHAEHPAGLRDGVHRYRPLHFPGRRYAFKALALVGPPAWRACWLPCNPVMPEMLRAAREFDGPLDAVHAFAFPYSYPILAGLNLAQRRGVPFALTPFLHLGDPTDPRDRTRHQYTSTPLRWLLKQADRVFVQTHSELAACVELGVPESRLTLQGLGIDAAECTGGDRESARRSWGVTADDIVVGHLANLSREKGTPALVAATRGLRVRTVLAGPAMPNFECAFKPSAGVIRLGPLTEAVKRDFFAGIDLFALPSRSDSFGLVLLEAWANGKPVVAYRAGGPADLVKHERDGLLVPCGDVPGLTAAIDRLARDAELRHRLGQSGQLRVADEFVRDDRLAVVRDTLMTMTGGEVCHAAR